MIGFCSRLSLLHRTENTSVGGISANESVEVEVEFPGVLPGDLAFFSPRVADASPLVFDPSRCEENAVFLRFSNSSASGFEGVGARDYDIFVFQMRGQQA